MTEDGKKFLLIMVPVSQMSWQQVKQVFIGSHYQTCLSYPDWHSRPFFVQDSLFYLFLGHDWQHVYND